MHKVDCQNKRDSLFTNAVVHRFTYPLCCIAQLGTVDRTVAMYTREVPRWADYKQNIDQNTYWKKNGANQFVNLNLRLHVEAS